VLKADRNFWMSLLHQEVKLQRLVYGLKKINTLSTKVDTSYRYTSSAICSVTSHVL
jgi:hypothetical protein